MLSDGGNLNALCQEGGFLWADLTLRNAAPPSQWNFGLLKNTASPAIDSTLSSLKTGTNYELTDASDPGYGTTAARKTVNRTSDAYGWPTAAIVGGYYQFTSCSFSWTATGTWSDVVRYVFMTTQPGATDTTGKLVSFAQCPADYSLLNGDVLSFQYVVTLK